jgi:hypothetical protein
VPTYRSPAADFSPFDVSSQMTIAPTTFMAAVPAHAATAGPEVSEPASTTAHNGTSPVATTSGSGNATTLIAVVPGNVVPSSAKGTGIAAVGTGDVSLASLGSVSGGQAVFDGNGGVRLAMDRNLAVSGGRLAEPYSGDRAPGAGAKGDGPAAATGGRGLARDASVAALEVPAPQRSDLITEFVPFDRAAVEQAIDRFFQQFEDLGAGLAPLQGPTDVLVELLAVAMALTAWKVVPKMLGRSQEDEAELVAVDVVTSLDGISGLPGSWSPEES